MSPTLNNKNNTVRLAVLQIAPIYLDAWATWEKLKTFGKKAIEDGANILVFSESLIPGYPGWISIDSSEDQQAVYARYWDQAVTLDGPLVADMKEFARSQNVMIIGGVAERQSGSTYATALTIGADGCLLSRHRKIKPTWRERLVWADGDGAGLDTFETDAGKIGTLSCWENWLPLARAAMYQREEFIHVGLWPGNDALVNDITRFIALEARSWSVAASGLLRPADLDHLPDAFSSVKDKMQASDIILQNGASQIVSPEGIVVAGPLIGEEGIVIADLDRESVLKQRQILDPSGHYSRPDVLRLDVNDGSPGWSSPTSDRPGDGRRVDE